MPAGPSEVMVSGSAASIDVLDHWFSMAVHVHLLSLSMFSYLIFPCSNFLLSLILYVQVVADASARPDFVASDLLSQAEHGPDSQVGSLVRHNV